jgi:hypothetical protein
MGSTGRRCALTLTLLAATGTLGCFAVNKVERDIDRSPTVVTGVGAGIIMPGQSVPVYQGPYHPQTSGQESFGRPGSNSGSATGGPGPSTTRSGEGNAPAGGGSNITMIGGATVDEERHQTIDETPQWFKYLRLPFAVVAAPFAYVADKLRSEPEPGPEVPDLEQAKQQALPPAPPVDYETATLRQLEDELDRRAAPVTTPRAGAPEGGALAAELAALRRGGAERAVTPATAPTRAAPPPTANTGPSPAPAPGGHTAARLASASGHVDRDGDGRTDQWIFREGGEVVQEMLDEDFDGRPDRTLQYDLATHQIRAIEEDANHDGRVDTWTSVRDGAIVRRRADDDADGHVDTWSYYRSGEITRLERDASGDGFRDRVSHYDEGRLLREEQDDDADGLADVVKHYDAEERIRRVEEDTNGDGQIDVISHYDAGRLKRRELLDAALLKPAPSMSEHN